MKYIIGSIKERQVEYTKTYNRLIDLGISKEDIIVNLGCKPSDVSYTFDYHVLLHNFLFQIVPKAIELQTDIVYLEDNVYPLKKAEDIITDPEKINWLGYIFNQSHYICGTKMVYFPLKILVKIKNSKHRMKHIDRFVRLYGLKHDCLIIDKNYIRLYKSKSCWGTNTQKTYKDRQKQKLIIEEDE